MDPSFRALLFGLFFLFSLSVTLWVFYEYDGASLAREVLYYVIAAAVATIATLPALWTSAFTLDIDGEGVVNRLGLLAFIAALFALSVVLLYLVRVRHRALGLDLRMPARAPAPPPVPRAPAPPPAAPPPDSEATLLGDLGAPAAPAPAPPPPAAPPPPEGDATQIVQRPTTDSPFIAIRSGPGAGQFVQLQPDSTIGRIEENLVTLADSSVSRRHAVIRLLDGKWTLFDLGSTNGSWLLAPGGKQQIEGTHTLAEGDHIEIGVFELEFTRSPRS